jgi:DNA-binding NtrC family response regulator
MLPPKTRKNTSLQTVVRFRKEQLTGIILGHGAVRLQGATSMQVVILEVADGKTIFLMKQGSPLTTQVRLLF